MSATRSQVSVAAPEIRFQRPELPALAEVAPYYELAEQARYFANGGPCQQLLEQRLQDLLGGSCILTASGTAGLLIALRGALGPASGRPVITPSFTFAATACAIEWAGFRPLFVDIEPRGWHLDPEELERALRLHPDTAGVLACSTFGTPPPRWVREAYRELCARAGVPLLFDSAAAFGSLDDQGILAGSAGDTEVFSFHATKPFAIGEGGLVVTHDERLAEQLRALANFGMPPGARVAQFGVGLNAKLCELGAATGLAMLDRFPGVLARRRAAARSVQEAIGSDRIRYQDGSGDSTWQIMQLLVPDAPARERLLQLAGRDRIQARGYFDPPLHQQGAFVSAGRVGGLPVTNALSPRMVSLPMANDLTSDEATRIAAIVREAVPS